VLAKVMEQGPKIWVAVRTIIIHHHEMVTTFGSS